MAKYLDDNGLLYFWGKIKAWVTSQGYTKNAGTITSVTTTAGAHTAINVSSGGVSFKVPTQTSHLTNNSNFVADANYVHTDNNFTSTLKTKLDGIAAGAEVNVVKGISQTSTGVGVDLSLSSGILSLLASTGTITEDTTNPSRNYYVTGLTVATTLGGVRTYIDNNLALKANIASPTFTGTPAAPTAAAGTNTTQIATTAFVTTAINNASVGAATFKGVISSGSAISSLTDYKAGWYWIVDTAGTYVGQKCEPGDFIYCISNYSSSYKASDFSVVQTNLDIAAITNAEIDVICSDGSMTGPS